MSNGAWYLIGRFVAFPFESRYSRHLETLGKSFTRSTVVFVSIRAVSGATLSSSDYEEATYIYSLN